MKKPPFNPKDNTVSLDIRFWSRVNKNGPLCIRLKSRCWLWEGHLVNGYGCISVDGKMEYTHRHSYKIHKEEILEGLSVLHHCDNPICVNPKHLFIGTQNDNMQDCISKNRNMKGETHYLTFLTEEIVREIRKRYKCKSRTDGATAIARELGLSPCTIWDIVVRNTWKHVE